MNAMTAIIKDVDVSGEITQAGFRNAMSKVGAAVNIVTTDGPAGMAGFAASAVCSVTDSPPTLLICLNRSSSVFSTVEANKAVCVNTLSAGHEKLSALFGGKTPVEERFAAARWERGATGAPMLEDAIVSFDCLVKDSVDVGTHKVLFCEVIGIKEGDGAEALIYFQRAYHKVGQAGE